MGPSFTALTIFISMTLSQTLEEGLVRKIETFATYIEKSSAPALYKYDFEILKTFVTQAEEHPDVLFLRFLDGDRKTVGAALPSEIPADAVLIERAIHSEEDDGDAVGHMVLAYTLSNVTAFVNRIENLISVAMVFIVMLQIGLLFVMRKF